MIKVEKLSDEEWRDMDFVSPLLNDKYLPCNIFTYIDRRVGFAIVAYRDSYWKFPHSLVPETKEEGQQVESVCTECKYSKMYDDKQNAFYCPRCES